MVGLDVNEGMLAVARQKAPDVDWKVGPAETLQTVTGKARFASLESWIYTDIKGWTLTDVIDEEGYERLRRYAPQKLGRFVLPDGSVEPDAPAHIVTVGSGRRRS